ncbi:hypothetical protein A2V68_03185 [candidate division Kazan bacterium RBG_13_50_9]|uniref:Uncharacterized protein n=1 Tax=candidate division Kazan bacterium RBG_13_50_9 TaxID=1798535 RepID=A0A1F4NSU0_UNCK3|nr:MAG: hypothetical protein A2V68_03185 [candidate division Kazan bacterium RBG_13_50_9]
MDGVPKLKIAGMVAAVIVVVGVTTLIAKSNFPGKGVSADLGDVAAGAVVVMGQETYDALLADLGQYFKETDQSSQDNIIKDVVKRLEAVLE